MSTTTQALVIGGGIAGAAVAAHLGRAGRQVVLLERKAGPHHKVCGEFVSGEAALYLRDLGIDLDALGAVPISTVKVYARHTMAAASLPFPAFSVSRRALDEAILRTAAACGVELRRGHAVRSLHPDAGQWIAQLDDGSNMAAGDTFLASGKHDLREWKRPPGRQNDFIAFKLHWRLAAAQTAALDSCVELYLFPGGYAGLELVENGVANLCLVIRRARFAMLGSRWDLLVATLRSDILPLHERLAGATPCWDRPLAITSIPYGYMAGRSDGPWRLGDQAAVIPSFAGDGISIALHSAQLAARHYLAGKTSFEFQSRLAHDIAGPVRNATLLSRMLAHPEAQAAAIVLARLAPALLGHVASRTRIPSRYLVAADEHRPAGRGRALHS